jgi:hypothetical protein
MTKNETKGRDRYWTLRKERDAIQERMRRAFEKGWPEGGRVLFKIGNMTAPAQGVIITFSSFTNRLFVDNQKTRVRRWIHITDVCGRGD